MVVAYLPLWSAGTVFEDWHWLAKLGLERLGLLGFLNSIVGFNLPVFHLASLLVHLVNTLMVAVCVALLHSRRAAVVAGGLFGLAPQQAEVVSYLGVQPELTAATFLFLACLLTIATREIWWLPVIAACVGLAIWTKPSAIVGLLLLPLVAQLGERHKWSLLPWIGALAVVLIVAGGSIFWNPYSWQSEYSALGYAGQQAARLWRFAFFDLSLDPQAVTAAVAGVALVAWLAVFGLALVPWTGFWWLETALACWVACALLPRFVVRIPELVHLHHLYLAMAGISAYVGVRVAPVAARVAR